MTTTGTNQPGREASAWPETVELTLDGIAQGGEGVGRWQERVVFAAGGLPGERVLVELLDRHPTYARGEVREVLAASPDRTPGRDDPSGHMPWQHVAYEAQLRYKRQILSDQLAKIGGMPGAPVDETVPAARQWGYRTTARLHSDGRQVGYFAPGSNELRPLAEDPLLHPALNRALRALPGALALSEGEVGPLEVLLRGSETHGYVLGGLSGGDRQMRMAALRWRARCPLLAGVAVDGRPPVVYGADRLVEELSGVTFLLRPTTFSQANLAAAETLLGLAREGLALQGGERLLDLYCGAGAFALPLAREAGAVVGIESWGGAVEDARESAEVSEIQNVEFVVGPVERALAAVEGPVDAVVLDPPRRGCHPAAVEGLLRLRPARIVYVSCQPATLARDLALLAAGGYAVRRVTPVDLFPQTPHIESVTVLERGE